MPETDPLELLKEVKKDIGARLRLLKEAKAHKDNYATATTQRARDCLSLALVWKAELYQRHPELRPAKQLTLFPRGV